jgi:nucleoside-diphosphate-sugar epimerase
MSRVLVTGAGGFIGRHTLAPLLSAGLEVHALTSRPLPAGKSAQELAGESAQESREKPAGESAQESAQESREESAQASAEVHWHRADLLDPGSTTALMLEVRPTHLLHLAWYTRPGAFWTSLENLDWVRASLGLLRMFGESGGQRAVLAGTCAEYSWQRDTHCVEQETVTRPATLYGAAKHGLHVVAAAWARQTGVAFAWGRVFHLYGPHEHPDRLVSSVACALLRGEEALCTHGRQLRDFLYVPDLGEAFAALLLSEVTGPVNMASGEPMRVAYVVAAIAEAAGRSELVRLGALPANPEEPERLTADVRRLREEVGWSPSVGLREGAERTVSWWRQAQVGAGAQTPEIVR